MQQRRLCSEQKLPETLPQPLRREQALQQPDPSPEPGVKAEVLQDTNVCLQGVPLHP